MKTVQHNKKGSLESRTEDEKARFAAFVSDLRARGRAPKTIGSYRSDWIGFTEWFLADCGQPFSIENLAPEQVVAYRDSLEGQAMRPATINRKLVFLKRYASWAEKVGLKRHESPAQTIRAVKSVAQGPRRPRPLSDLELKRFLREVELRAPVRDQAIVYTLLETGLRVSEIVALNISQLIVSGRRCVILMDDMKQSGIRTRRIGLTGQAKRKLRQYLIERGRGPGSLFQGERGPLTANAVQRIVRKYCGFAKVKVSPSTLRHTFATMFLKKDGDVVELADLLGHESLETTRLYLNQGPATVESPMTGATIRPRVIMGDLGDEG